MQSKLILLRNMVLQSILDYQTAPYTLADGSTAFAYNKFTAAASYLPFQKIEDPDTQAGKLWVIGSNIDDKDRKTRFDPSGNTPPLVTRDIHIQIAYQQSNVSPDDTATLDNLCFLQEQIRDVVKNYNYIRAATPSFQPLWCRNETLKDDNGQVFHYYMLREATVFETYFTACFTLPHQ